MYTYIYIYIYIYIYVCVCVCVFVCLPRFVYVYIDIRASGLLFSSIRPDRFPQDGPLMTGLNCSKESVK